MYNWWYLNFIKYLTILKNNLVQIISVVIGQINFLITQTLFCFARWIPISSDEAAEYSTGQ